jgi:hypothetical protein
VLCFSRSGGPGSGSSGWLIRIGWLGVSPLP